MLFRVVGWFVLQRERHIDKSVVRVMTYAEKLKIWREIGLVVTEI